MLHLTSALPEWSSWPNDGDGDNDESPVPCVMRIVRGQICALDRVLLLFFPTQRSRHFAERAQAGFGAGHLRVSTRISRCLGSPFGDVVTE
jgi:hypothetical protein